MLDPDLNIVIPTYKREDILQRLISDLVAQTVNPQNLFIVDGDPASGKVLALLRSMSLPFKMMYIPSNHANAPYQRFLGSASIHRGKFVVFFDDDIRIKQLDFLENLIAPLRWSDRQIAGVSSRITFPGRHKNTKVESEVVGFPTNLKPSNIKPGEISPVGYRAYPVFTSQPYAVIRWLHGAVMAFQVEVVKHIGAKPDTFAMSHVGCGFGVDDTYFSRCALGFGELLLANNAIAEHPDADESRITSKNMYRHGFAAAYSRRFLNDHYRLTAPPRVSDRLSLVKTYLGNNGLNLWRFIRNPGKDLSAYARGYFLGSVQGLLVKPSAKNLTPRINWLMDAEDALRNTMEI